jgi:lipoyl(octanoyl) transferase
LYSLAHDAFIGVLTESFSDAGKTLNLSQNKEVSTNAPSHEPFLCFQRRAVGDVVATPAGATANSKVLGSAQRRSRGALLQHGSLLLEKSPAAPELVGLCDLADCVFSTGEISPEIGPLVERLEAVLGLQFSPAELPPDLQLKAREISNKKYGSAAWTKRR